MKANKIILNGEVLIDLTGDTATEDKALQGARFHKADGTEATGALVIPEPQYQEKDITVSANGSVTIVPDAGYDGLRKANVTVNVPVPDGYIQPSGSMNITENGTYDVADYASISVSISTSTAEEYDGSVTVV